MSDRQVRIIISADVQNALRGMAQVEQGLGRVGSQGREAGSQASSFGDKLKKAAETAGIVTGFAAVTAAVGRVISVGMDYENNLNQLASTNELNATQMAKVSDRAKELGSDLTLPATSAGDAAGAMLELSKGGMSVADSMVAARGTLLLAAAANISGAEAATLQSNALNGFQLSASEATHVADLMVNSANAGADSIEGVGEALTKVGGIANQFGVSIEDTTTALGIFAKNGVTGAEAGTLLRGTLTGLNNQSKPAQNAMRDLGLTVFDASGKFVGMRSVTEQLSAAQGRMTTQAFNAATQVVFGNEAMAGAAYLAAGAAKGWDEMSDATRNGAGVQAAAAAQTKGLSGAFDSFMSSVDGVAVSLYEKFSPAMVGAVGLAASVVTGIGDIVGWFNQLPAPIQAGVTALTALILLKGPLASLWVAMKASGVGLAIQGEMLAARLAMQSMRLEAAATGGSMGALGAGMRLAGIAAVGLGNSLKAAFMSNPIGLALVAATTALTFFMSATDDASGSTADFTGAIDENTGALSKNAPAVIASASAKSGAFAAYKAIGGSVKEYTDALLGNTTAQDALHTRLLDSAEAALKASGGWQRMVDKGVVLSSSSRQVASDILATGDAGQYASDGMDAALNASKLYASESDKLGTEATQTNDVLEATGGAAQGVGDAAAAAAPPMEVLADALKEATENASLLASLTDGALQLAAVSAAASDAARALDLFKIAQDNADGRSRSLDDALVAQQSTLMALADAWDAGTAAATENKEAGDLNTEALTSWNVTALAATEDGRKLYGELSNLADQHMATTEAAYSNEIAEGRVAGANEVARKTASESRAAFLQLAQQHGLNEQQAIDLANKLGILDGTQIDDKVFDTINQDAEAQRKLREAQAAEIANKTFSVNAVDNASPVIDGIQRRLQSINGQTSYVYVNTVATSSTAATMQQGLVATYEDGGVVHAAAGRLVSGRGTSMVADGRGPGLTWAEAATNKEYYLSMKSGMESRNRALAGMAVSDLGGQAMWGRAGDVRAGTFSPPTGSMTGGGGAVNVAAPTVQVFIDGQEMMGRVDVLVNGKVAAVTSGLRTAGAQRV